MWFYTLVVVWFDVEPLMFLWFTIGGGVVFHTIKTNAIMQQEQKESLHWIDLYYFWKDVYKRKQAEAFLF